MSVHSATCLVRFGIFELILRAGELHRACARARFQRQAFVVLAMLLSLITCALAAAGLQRGDMPAANPSRSNSDSCGQGARQQVLRVPKEDGITSRHLAELQRQSATARELLDRVTSLPATILILRGYPLLTRQVGVYGRGRFWIDGGHMFGLLEYQTASLHNLGTQCVIVHELAHALEVAGVDRRNGTAGLRAFVLSRALGDHPLNWRGSETEFPREVAVVVLHELLGRVPARNTLSALAEAHHITLPVVSAARAPCAKSSGQLLNCGLGCEE